MKQERESKVFKKLRRIRDEMLAEEKRVGSDKFWADVNRRGEEFARRHGVKYASAALSVKAVRERPAKYRPR